MPSVDPAAYTLGRFAFVEGRKLTEAPYDSHSPSRKAWEDGWLDESKGVGVPRPKYPNQYYVAQDM